jgi:GAF domain-containing protein
MTDAVLRAVVDAAVAATGAEVGWVTDSRNVPWRVAATAGRAAGLDTRAWPAGGVVGFVVESDQPAALVPRPGVELTADVEAVLGHVPTAVLVVPCAAATGTVGALGLADKAGGGPFSFDDLELTGLLGPIAGAAVVAAGGPEVPDSADLGAALVRLSTTNPERYERVAVALAVLLDV